MIVEICTKFEVKHQHPSSNAHTHWEGTLQVVIDDYQGCVPIFTIRAFNGHKPSTSTNTNASSDTSIAGLDVQVTRGDYDIHGQVDASDFDQVIEKLGIPNLTLDHLVRFSIARLKPRMLGCGQDALKNWLKSTVSIETNIGDDQLWWHAYKTPPSATA